MNDPIFDVVVTGFVGKPPTETESGTLFISAAQTISGKAQWFTVQVNAALVTDEIRELRPGHQIRAFGRAVVRESHYTNQTTQEDVTKQELMVVCYRLKETEVASNGDGVEVVSTKESRAKAREEKQDTPAPARLRVA